MTLDEKIDNFLIKFYEDSIDAYHAFMGTYTDAEADDDAPDKLIEKAKEAIKQLIEEEVTESYKKGYIDKGIEEITI